MSGSAKVSGSGSANMSGSANVSGSGSRNESGSIITMYSCLSFIVLKNVISTRPKSCVIRETSMNYTQS